MLRKLSSIYFYVNVISNFCTLTNEYATSAINDFRQKKEKKLLDRTKSILCGPIMLLDSKNNGNENLSQLYENFMFQDIRLL